VKYISTRDATPDLSFKQGKILLELIEVQTGSCLGKDDIIRIEDKFGRAKS